jgi:hypothetical protein
MASVTFLIIKGELETPPSLNWVQFDICQHYEEAYARVNPDRKLIVTPSAAATVQTSENSLSFPTSRGENLTLDASLIYEKTKDIGVRDLGLLRLRYGKTESRHCKTHIKCSENG